jgi:hypothetical protein
LQGSGADTLLVAAIPKFAAQAIRKVYDIGWKPAFFMTNVSASVGSVMKPAGLDKSQGIITGGYLIVRNYPPRWSGAPSHDPLGNRSDAKSSQAVGSRCHAMTTLSKPRSGRRSRKMRREFRRQIAV